MMKQLWHLAVGHGHAELQSEQFEVSSKFSIYTKIVYLLLNSGAQLDAIYTGFIPTTAHSNPTYLIGPNTAILKMLMAAGAELKETSSFEWDKSLQSLARNSIRMHLKHIYPEKNLYTIIPELPLPQRMQAYLLFYTQPEVETNLKREEKEFLCSTADKNIGSVLSLIQAGVDVNVQDKNGMTALMIASQTDHVELVVKLTEAGANINIQNNSGDTALICATKEGKINCVHKLIELGANVNIRGHNGRTALFHACAEENTEYLEALIEGGANPDIPDDDSDTALIEAIRQGPVSSINVNKLITAGADVNYTPTIDKKKMTQWVRTRPLVVAAREGNRKAIKKLIEAGADLNSVKPDHALGSAACEGHVDCVKLFIEESAEW